jgi:selenide,water dikinase
MHSRLPSRDIVLLGLGHTNAHVLRMWRMQPIPDARLTCVSNFPTVTYSGMLPGVLAGQYPPERMEIDLVRLCAAAGARLIIDEVSGLDVPQRRLLFADRTPVPFDVLSIGIGSIPQFNGVEVEADFVLTIKPMQTFLARLTDRLKFIATHSAATRQGSAATSDAPLRIAIVGGGAGGVEVAFCIPHHVRRILRDVPLQIALIHSGETLVPGAMPRTSRVVERELRCRGVELHLGRSVARVTDADFTLDDGRQLPADLVIWATGAAPPPLLAALDLPKDGRGFLLTRPTLQTTADAPIFIVGDTGTRHSNPTAKAGVYAVRQGPVLWENLHNQLVGRPLIPYEPQPNFLKLLNTGDGRAIGEYKGVTLHNAWLWRLKDRIDGRFMDKYQDYTPMMDAVRRGLHIVRRGSPDPAEFADRRSPGSVGRPAVRSVVRSGDRTTTKSGDRTKARAPTTGSPATGAPMKCTGCGGKLGAQALSNALHRLDVPTNDHVLLGLGQPDDAAVLQFGGGRTVVTTDFFVAPLDDPYLVGRIAALNAVSDAYAMGARPVAALTIATIPDGDVKQQEELLYQLLAGSQREFAPIGTALVGGHTIEGPQVTIGFTILAEPGGDVLCTKAALQPGDALILTRPLGTGSLLAAHARALCPAAVFPALLQTMLASNGPAAELAVELGVRAMTDVTGFGLAGHLLEMLRASHVAAVLDLGAIPLLPGASDLFARGIESTLAPSNRQTECDISCPDSLRTTPGYAALFDPQTNGGLLIGIANNLVESFTTRLAETGGMTAVPIGRVVEHDGAQPLMRIA